MIKKRYLKFSILTCLVVAGIFSIFSLVFYFGKWERLFFIFFAGLFCGGLAIPELEPKAVKRPIIFQTVVGAICGFITVIAFSNNVEYVFGGLLLGAILGFTANFWLKHVQIP